MRSRLFRGLKQRRTTGAELLEERSLVSLGRGKMALLDVTEAADLFRDDGKADGDRVILRRELGEHLFEHRLVVLDQLAFGTALERAAERIERRSAEEFELCQETERRHAPWAEAHLAWKSRGLVATGQERRRQMKLEAQLVAVEFARHLLQK